MTVSTGGTISWTPKTDSAYQEHVEYLIADDTGKKDTLTFNLIVNNYKPARSIRPLHMGKNNSIPFKIITTFPSSRTIFSLSSSVASICMYDINGRLVDRIIPRNSSYGAHVAWPAINGSGNGKIPTGKYFAKASDGKNCIIRPLLVVK